jgi:hypothetical protein
MAATLRPSTPIWVFLARRLFLGKPTILGIGKAWISLDSLVRIETYQWVTRLFPEIFFPPASGGAKRRRNGLPTIWQRRTDKLLIGQA